MPQNTEKRHRPTDREVDERRVRILELVEACWTAPEIALEMKMTIRHVHTDIDRMRKGGLDVPLIKAPSGWGAYQVKKKKRRLKNAQT